MSLSRELTSSHLKHMLPCSHLSVCFSYFYKLSSFVSFRLSALMHLLTPHVCENKGVKPALEKQCGVRPMNPNSVSLSCCCIAVLII